VRTRESFDGIVLKPLISVVIGIQGLAKRGLTLQPRVGDSIVKVGFDFGASSYENVIASNNAAKV